MASKKGLVEVKESSLGEGWRRRPMESWETSDVEVTAMDDCWKLEACGLEGTSSGSAFCFCVWWVVESERV